MTKEHQGQSVTDVAAVARVHDEWLPQLPDDLYIPRAAFLILLDYFEGPLDFLLYLVHKNGVNLLELDIAPIASQYLNYIEPMQALHIELAADYLVMAASLADIKSRLLLPRACLQAPEDDPRQDLLQRLQHYARIKQAGSYLDQCKVLERDTFLATVSLPDNAGAKGDARWQDMEEPVAGAASAARDAPFKATVLATAMQLILKRPRMQQHVIDVETVQLAERIDHIVSQLASGKTLDFNQLLNPRLGIMGIVVTFMAVLELVRQNRVRIVSCCVEQPLRLQGDYGDAA